MICQMVELAWIEAKFPDLFEHLQLEARYIELKMKGKEPDPFQFMQDHIKECPWCRRTDGNKKKLEEEAKEIGKHKK